MLMGLVELSTLLGVQLLKADGLRFLRQRRLVGGFDRQRDFLHLSFNPAVRVRREAELLLFRRLDELVLLWQGASDD